MRGTNSHSLEFYGTSIGGWKFYSKSPFRSRQFLTATGWCLACETYLAIVIYEYMRTPFKFALPALLGIAFLVGGMWWSAYRQSDWVREILSAKSITEIEEGSSLDLVLGINALNSISVAIITALCAVGVAFLAECCLPHLHL